MLRSTSTQPDVAIVFLRELWAAMVGSDVARNSEPVRLNGRTLAVEVNDPVWKTQMEALKPLMIRAVNEQWGCVLIERIRIRLRPR